MPRILVIDDENLVCFTIERILASAGHTVVTAENGAVGLRRQRETPFDLVITDRSMPEANGDLVAFAVKARNSETPVILLTGFGDIMKDEGECPVGVDRILTKPVTSRDLRRAMAKVMAGKKE